MKTFKIKKVQYKTAMMSGKPINLIAGHKTYKGSIQILVNQVPKNKDFIFKKYGTHFYAEKDGFVSIYKHGPFSTDGFGGRPITLNIIGGERIFEGSLWDPMGFDDMEGIPEYRAVSITDDPKVMKAGHLFYSGYVTLKLFEKLSKKAKEVKP